MKVSKNDFQYMLECIERDLATILVEKRGMTIRQALSLLYDSDTYRLLQNPNTGLYFQSPQYVYSYLQEEIEQGKIGINCSEVVAQTTKYEQLEHLKRMRDINAMGAFYAVALLPVDDAGKFCA